MKTYFKSTVGDVYMMLDNDRKQVVLCSSFSNVKNIDILISELNYNQFSEESTDSTKWLNSDETSYLVVQNDVINSL
jgi:glycosylphosphatidylinositol transamidase (GPIT) subunit GPI8